MGAVAKAAVEVVEETSEVIEETLEALENLNNLNGTTRKQQIIILVAVGVGAAVVAGVVSHYATKKVLSTKYERLMEEELEKTREFFASREHIAIDTSAPVVDPEELLLTSKRDNAELDAGTNEFLVEAPQPAIIKAAEAGKVDVVRKNAFEEPLDNEKLWTAQNDGAIAEGKPYVLTKEEFFEAEHAWPQLTYTFFEGDGVLADEREAVVDDLNDVVGDMNVTRIGWRSEDPNTVYIRSPKHEIEIEVVRSTGTYAAEVHGFQHSEETFEARQPKFRYGED